MVRIEEIPIESIVIPEERARATFTPEQEAELEASIKNHGFTVPILVSPLPDGKYLLIDGEHRTLIAKKLGMEKIPAVITEGDEKKISMLNILANTARGTQDPIGVAQMLKKAKDAGASEEELAAATGHTLQWIRFYLVLNDLPEHYKEKLRSGELKVGHIKEAMRLPNPMEIDSALQSTLIHNWTVEQLRYYVERRLMDLKEVYKEGEPEELPPPPTPEEAQEIVMYGNCMACRRSVPRKDMRMPAICQDCYDFLMYFMEQFGDPRKAMEILYKAYNFYMDAMKAAQPAQISAAAQPSTPTLPKAPAGSGPAIGSNPTSELDPELLELARKLKALKQAGLL